MRDGFAAWVVSRLARVVDFLVFFFSSRRRHTRSDRDWSSDVCSSDLRVPTRNYVAIISGVNCSASVSEFVKGRFGDVQRDYPNVDGVIAVTHKSGCGTKLFGEDHLALQRVLAGYAKHPNVAAYILIGLGCEVNQAAVMMDRQKMGVPGHPERKPFLVNIQEAGGIRKTVEAAGAEVATLLPIANDG